jgi:hypothetical protein
VVSENGSIIFYINTDSITKIPSLLKILEGQTLHEETLSVNYTTSNSVENVTLLQSYMDKYVVIPNIPPPYKSNIFPKISRQAITMMCLSLGYDHDRTVDEVILGFMSTICCPSENSLTKFHYAKFLVNIIPYQLTEFHASRYFLYQSYLVYPILYFQASHFSEYSTENRICNW